MVHRRLLPQRQSRLVCHTPTLCKQEHAHVHAWNNMSNMSATAPRESCTGEYQRGTHAREKTKKEGVDLKLHSAHLYQTHGRQARATLSSLLGPGIQLSAPHPSLSSARTRLAPLPPLVSPPRFARKGANEGDQLSDAAAPAPTLVSLGNNI